MLRRGGLAPLPGCEVYWGWCPGVSLRSTPGYKLATLRVEQAGKGSRQAVGFRLWDLAAKAHKDRKKAGAATASEHPGGNLASGLG